MFIHCQLPFPAIDSLNNKKNTSIYMLIKWVIISVNNSSLIDLGLVAIGENGNSLIVTLNGMHLIWILER